MGLQTVRHDLVTEQQQLPLHRQESPGTDELDNSARGHEISIVEP